MAAPRHLAERPVRPYVPWWLSVEMYRVAKALVIGDVLVFAFLVVR